MRLLAVFWFALEMLICGGFGFGPHCSGQGAWVGGRIVTFLGDALSRAVNEFLLRRLFYAFAESRTPTPFSDWYLWPK